MITEKITVEDEDYSKALRGLAAEISKEPIDVPVNFATIRQEIITKQNQKPKFRLSWLVNQE
jgi:hypothetical protein